MISGNTSIEFEHIDICPFIRKNNKTNSTKYILIFVNLELLLKAIGENKRMVDIRILK